MESGTYTRLPFGQYFADQSLGAWGGTPITKVDYKKVEYTCGKIFKHKHDAYYCVMYNESRDVYQIYFKETSSKSQWLANFNFPKKYYDSFQYKGKDIQLKSARGWTELYCALKWYIRNELSALVKEHGKKEVEIIGWSLGSGIAQLCSQDLYFNFQIKSHLYTYGSVKPWYGRNKDMKDYLKDCCVEVYNFRNREDVVGYMVPLPKYFAMNHVTLKATDKKCWLFELFKPKKHHTSYYKEELYKEIK